MIAGIPPRDTPIPRPVSTLAQGRFVRPVWRNELGGLTFEVAADTGRLFVKWAPAGSDVDLRAEAQRLRWAAQFTAVPQVLDQGANAAGGWLVTAGLPGDSAVSHHWLTDPKTAVTAIGSGLRRLHEALPVDACPFSWSAEDRLARVSRVHARDGLDPSRWDPVHADLTTEEALAQLAEPPPVDRLVVCHGDACAPNALLSRDGTWTGHVDLGSLGIADRWADLAVATWSLDWNYGPGWDRVLLDAYGATPDPVRTTYYRLLWDLSP